ATFENICINWCQVGFGVNTSTTGNGDNLAFIHPRFCKCKSGFQTNWSQNVGFSFFEPEFVNVTTCFDLVAGGQVSAVGTFAFDCNRLVLVGGGGVGMSLTFVNTKIDGIGPVPTPPGVATVVYKANGSGAPCQATFVDLDFNPLQLEFTGRQPRFMLKYS